MNGLMEDMPWLIGIALAVLFFAWFEAQALRHPERHNTLSKFIYSIGRRWPVSIYLAGLFTGILIVHLFAHFCPS